MFESKRTRTLEAEYRVMRRLTKRLTRQIQLKTDLYLTYTSAVDLELSGFLISAKDGLNELIALCPLPRGYTLLREFRPEIVRQFKIALRIGADPLSCRRLIDAIDLRSKPAKPRIIPGWIFGLSCIPLTYDWDGRLVSPRPFCPSLFDAMLAQPLARHWLDDKQPLEDRNRLTSGSAFTFGRNLENGHLMENHRAQKA